MKKTNREKDYVVIGELSRKMADVNDQLLFSRSARDLIALGREFPDIARSLSPKRPLLAFLGDGSTRVGELLDAERRHLISLYEMRLKKRMEASRSWADRWPALLKQMEGLPLRRAHELMVLEATNILPETVEEDEIHG